MNSPVGKLLNRSCQKFPSDQHLLQKYFSDLSRREAQQKEDPSSESVNIPHFEKFVYSILLMNRFLKHQKFCEVRESVTETFVEVGEETIIQSEEDLETRLNNIAVSDSDIAIMTRSYKIFFSSGAAYTFVYMCSPAFLKVPLRESVLFLGVCCAFFVSRDLLNKWMLLDTPRATMIRSHQLGEKSAHVLLVQAEERMKELRPYTNDESVEERPFYLSIVEKMIRSDCSDMISSLYKN